MEDAATSGGAPPVPAADHCRFTVVGLASPQLLPRLLGLFAQQNLLPLRLWMDRTPELMALDIVQDALDAGRAGIILEKIRVLPEVSDASLAHVDAGARTTDPRREHRDG